MLSYQAAIELASFKKVSLGDSSKFLKRWSTYDTYVYKSEGYLGKGFVT